MLNMGRKILITLILFKLGIFYHLIDVENVLLLAVVTGLFIFLGYFTMKMWGVKDRYFFAFYIIMTIIMYADVLHFRFFGELLSISSIKIGGLALDSKKAILDLFDFRDVLLFLDIFLMGYYGCINSEVCINKRAFTKVKYLVTLFYVILISFIVFPKNLNFSKLIKNQEFFNNHFMAEKATKRKEVALEKLFVDKQYKTNRYKAAAAGRNVMYLQLESFQDFVIGKKYLGQEITPNLNKLIEKDTIYFKNFYQQNGKGNTADSEFVAQNSLYTNIKYPTYMKYKDNYFRGIGNILKENGYGTIAFHGNEADFWGREEAYKSMGIDEFISEIDFLSTEKIGMGISDGAMFSEAIDVLDEMNKPFYSLITTLTTHIPYEMPREKVDFKLTKDDEGTEFGRYLESMNYLDKEIGKFMDNLKKEKMYDNTMFVIYGDHFGLRASNKENKKRISKMIGREYTTLEMMNIPLIIHIPNSKIVDKPKIVGGHMDILPTVLNLLGLKIENHMFGTDLLNSTEGFVATQTQMIKGSFIKDDVVFEMSRDGIFGNSDVYNRVTKEKYKPEDYIEDYNKGLNLIHNSNYILENDILRQVYEGNKNIDEIQIETKEINRPELIAHAGGRYKGLTYTNSKEAIQNSYDSGVKYIEVDITMTKDNVPVLLHSWDGLVSKLFGVLPKKYTVEEFKNFEMANGMTQMTVDDLMAWLKEHEDAYVITDVKGDNHEILKYISDNYMDMLDRVIPQIYSRSNYSSVEYLGYKHIILTLYRSDYDINELMMFAKRNELFAIVSTMDRLATEDVLKLKRVYVPVYFHTINSEMLYENLKEQWKMQGIYTDDIGINEISE